MKVKVIHEAGFEVALFGLGLSHGLTSGMDLRMDTFATHQKEYKQLMGVAERIAGKTGENKFLRMMQVWLDIQAPRYWWAEFDTFKVGTTAQSESTMHSIHKIEITPDCFEGEVELDTVAYMERLRQLYNSKKDPLVWKELIQIKPESWLQRRIVNLNYAVLRNMIDQRTGHRLSEWAIFIGEVMAQIAYPTLLPCRGFIRI